MGVGVHLLEVLEHQVAGALHQLVDIFGGHTNSGDRLQNTDLELATGEGAAGRVVDVGVAFGHNGQDGQLGLDGQVEGALLEGQEVSRVQARAGALGENPNARLDNM